MAETRKSYFTIGELVGKFKKYYPDLTSSKLRFLESKGLIVPKRADNKYRVYFKNDVAKINLILKMQKDFFMPLEIIREKLQAIDFENIDKAEKNDKGALKELQSNLEETEKKLKTKKIPQKEITEKYKISDDYLNELIEEGLVNTFEENGKKFIDAKDLEILRVIGHLSGYGIYIKHLKLFENSAIRQSNFLQQIIYPLIMSKGKDSYKKASKMLYSLESLFSELNDLLFKRENRQFLENHK